MNTGTFASGVLERLAGQVQLAALAFQFMTALPVKTPFQSTDVQVGRCIRYFPLCGFTLGVIAAATGFLLQIILPAPVVAALLVGLLALLTGGLHLDGLADSCDGLFHRGTPAERLARMKDSHLSALSALGLVLVLLLKWVAFSTLLATHAIWILPVAVTLARWTAVPAIVFFPYVRPQGMSASFKRYGGTVEVLIATAIAAGVAVPLWGLHGIVALAFAALLTTLTGTIAGKQINGMTGDIYGALNECSEVLLVGFWIVANFYLLPVTL